MSGVFAAHALFNWLSNKDIEKRIRPGKRLDVIATNLGSSMLTVR